MDRERARLKWLCRRGMRELDLVMEAYLARRYDAATAAQREAFVSLLACPDPQLFAFLTDRELPTEPAQVELVNVLKTLQRTAD